MMKDYYNCKKFVMKTRSIFYTLFEISCDEC